MRKSWRLSKKAKQRIGKIARSFVRFGIVIAIIILLFMLLQALLDMQADIQALKRINEAQTLYIDGLQEQLAGTQAEVQEMKIRINGLELAAEQAPVVEAPAPAPESDWSLQPEIVKDAKEVGGVAILIGILQVLRIVVPALP